MSSKFPLLRIFLIVTYVMSCSGLASQTEYAVVNSILLNGNKKTKEKIVLRELDFKEGDTIYLKNFKERLYLNEKRVLSTGMFSNVGINVKNWDTAEGHMDVYIDLQENWYIFPAPIFELADRNFNVWWNEQGRSLERVNYGLRLDHYNLTGNRDRLKLKLQFGFTRKYEAVYSRPFINDAQTIGTSTSIFYSENKELGYETRGNKTVFYKDDDERVLLKRFRVGQEIKYRPTIHQFHSLSLEFHRNSVDTAVSETLNPDYFLEGKNALKFFLLNYVFQYDKRVFNLYPEGGYLLWINGKKEGLGIFGEYNNLSISAAVENYLKVTKGIVFSTRVKAKTNLIRKKVAYANNTGLGYGTNIIHGYELYVMDGTDYAFAKTAVRWNFYEKTFDLANKMPMRQFKLMSFKMYLRMNVQAGWVNEPTYKSDNIFNNRINVGYGPALDIVLYNTFLFQLEYSFNHLGEKGFYLHNSISF